MLRQNRKQREQVEVNASSMADIAFLLLIFFLVTTAIVRDQGVRLILPPYTTETEPVKLDERNVFKVLLNSSDMLLVEDEPMELKDIRSTLIMFITNNGRNPEFSVSPEKAVVSFKADRGTSYDTYLKVLDELKAAYHTLRAEKLGITVDEYLQLSKEEPEDEVLLSRAKAFYPMQISIAEPSDLSTN